jgi:hypothetical protein
LMQVQYRKSTGVESYQVEIVQLASDNRSLTQQSQSKSAHLLRAKDCELEG